MLFGDTEYFNGKEWKYISEYVFDDKVLQYNEDGSSDLVTPFDYIHAKNKNTFYESVDEWLPTKITGTHEVVTITDNGLSKRTFSEVLAFCRDNEEERIFIPISTQMRDSEYSLTIPEKSLQGIIKAYKANVFPNEPSIQSFLKEVGSAGVTLSDAAFRLNEFQRQELLKGILGIKDGLFADDFPDWYFILTGSNSLEDAQAVVSLAHVTKGFSKVNYDRLRAVSRVHGDLNLLPLKVPDITLRQRVVGFYDRDTFTDAIVSNETDKYCFTVPSHMLVLRCKGHIFITGDVVVI